MASYLLRVYHACALMVYTPSKGFLPIVFLLFLGEAQRWVGGCPSNSLWTGSCAALSGRSLQLFPYLWLLLLFQS